MQYQTPFTCPDCSEHTFEIEADLESEKDLARANCTNCGHELEVDEITLQAKSLPGALIEKMITDAEALNRKYAGH